MQTIVAENSAFEANQLLNLGKSVQVHSIFPRDLRAFRQFRTRPGGGYFHWYKIPAAPMDGNTVMSITIGDAMEYHYFGDKRYGETPVVGGAQRIAEGLIDEWRINAFNVGEGRFPGVWIGENNTDNHKKALAEQTAYFKGLAAFADDVWFQGRKAEVGSMHRLAAEWLRLDPRKHEWLKDTSRGDVKTCPYCRTEVDALASICPTCTHVIDSARFNSQKAVVEEAQAQLKEMGISTEPPVLTPAPIQPPVRK